MQNLSSDEVGFEQANSFIFNSLYTVSYIKGKTEIFLLLVRKSGFDRDNVSFNTNPTTNQTLTYEFKEMLKSL
jgi:hypothetical protein